MNNNIESELVVSLDPVTQRRSLTDTPIRRFFEAAVQHEATDLLLRGGQPPHLRIHGTLMALNYPQLDYQQFESWIEDSLSPSQWAYFAKQGAVDLGMDFEMSDKSAHRVSNQRVSYTGTKCVVC